MVGLFEPFFLCAILVSVFICIEDARHERIPNKLVALLLALGLIYQAFFLAHPFSGLFFFLYALFASGLLWFSGIWPAGDAKLFSVLFLLLPEALYSSQSVVLDFLINCFVPIFIFMFFVILAKSRFGVLKEALKYSFNLQTLFMLAMILLGFVWFLMIVPKFLSVTFSLWMDYFLTMVLMFLVFELMNAFFSAKTEFLLVALAAARVLLDYRTVYSWHFLASFLSMVLVFVFLRFFILFLAFKLFTFKVPFNRLKAGMSPAEAISRKGDHFERHDFMNPSLISILHSQKEEAIHNKNCLTEEDVKLLQALRVEKKIPFSGMLINKVQPFAVFILAGYILTVIAGSDFLVFIAKALG
ncbi:MAG: prepilin peptidase [Candidatus Diapherotrites archaeon]